MEAPLAVSSTSYPFTCPKRDFEEQPTHKVRKNKILKGFFKKKRKNIYICEKNL